MSQVSFVFCYFQRAQKNTHARLVVFVVRLLSEENVIGRPLEASAFFHALPSIQQPPTPPPPFPLSVQWFNIEGKMK